MFHNFTPPKNNKNQNFFLYLNPSTFFLQKFSEKYVGQLVFIQPL